MQPAHEDEEQPPQPDPEDEPSDDLPIPNLDRRFAVCSELQAGQTTLGFCPKTIFSKEMPHFLHSYSYIGINTPHFLSSFFQSARNFSIPMSVRGCLTSWSITLNGIVAMCAPAIAASTT